MQFLAGASLNCEMWLAEPWTGQVWPRSKERGEAEPDPAATAWPVGEHKSSGSSRTHVRGGSQEISGALTSACGCWLIKM